MGRGVRRTYGLGTSWLPDIGRSAQSSASRTCRTGTGRIPSTSAGRAGRSVDTEHPAARAADSRWAMDGRRSDRPGERDLADERRPGGGATPVAAEASAAATARSHAGSSSRTPPEDAPNSSDRPSGSPRHGRGPPPPAGTAGGRARWPAGVPGPSAAPTSAWTSTARARRPAWGSAMAAPGVGGARHEQIAVGSISANPSRTHLEPGASHPRRRSDSCRRRAPGGPIVGSPSNVRTTSTACSNVRGPARSPSFVTWPVRSTAMPSSLASPTSASVHIRT